VLLPIKHARAGVDRWLPIKHANGVRTDALEAFAAETITVLRLQFGASLVGQFDLRTPAAAEARATGKILAAGLANQITRES